MHDLFQDSSLLTSMHLYPEHHTLTYPNLTETHCITKPWTSTNIWDFWVS